MRKLGMTAAMIALVVGAVPAEAAAPLAEGKTTTPWQVDFGNERCVALRGFDVDGKPLVLAIEPNPNDGGARVLFRLPASKSERLVGYERADFRIDGRPISDGVTLWPGEKDGLLLITGAADEGERSAKLAEIRELSLDGPRLKARLAVSGMPKVAEMLGRCNRGLLKLWGFAEAEQDRLASWPELGMPIGRLFTSEDYPVEAIRGGQQGEVRVRLMVDAAGRASNCKLRYSSGWPSLDAATCKVLISRARYRPAVDKAGQPMAAPAFHSVRWRMPG